MTHDLYLRAKQAHRERETRLEREEEERLQNARAYKAELLRAMLEAILGPDIDIMFYVNARDRKYPPRAGVAGLHGIEFYVEMPHKFLFAVPLLVRRWDWADGIEAAKRVQVFDLADIGEALMRAERLAELKADGLGRQNHNLVDHAWTEWEE